MKSQKDMERIAAQISKMDHSDRILALDRQQGVQGDPSEQRLCGTDARHGRLQVHASGSVLMCCSTVPECVYREPVSL